MFEDIMVDGIGLVGLNVAIVQRAKMFGMRGKDLLGLSTSLGFALGIIYRLQGAGLPVTMNDWISLLIFAIAMAVMPSGFVDVARDTGKQIARYTSGRSVSAKKKFTGVM